MCKLCLVIVGFVLSLSAVSYAQEQVSMRDMAVAQMYEYGEAVYDRGDYNEAAKVFSRILQIAPDNSGAYEYAKKLNQQGQMIELPAQMPGAPVITATRIEAPKQNFTPRREEVTTIVMPEQKSIPRQEEFTTATVAAPVITTSPIDPSVQAHNVMTTNEDLKTNIQMTDQSIDQLKKDIAGLHTQIEQGKNELQTNN